jgi:hypothetical protein
MYELPPTGEARSARRVDEIWAGPRITSPATDVGVAGTPFRHALTTDATGPVALIAASPLPPGLSLAADAIAGTPTAAGSFVVELRAGDGPAARGQRLRIVVDADSDGDGFSDEIETALGSDPNSASSTPAAGAAAVAGGTLIVTGARVKLPFASPDAADTISVSGTLELPADAALSGATVTVDVGGAVRTFVLGARGVSRRDAAHPGDSLRIRPARTAAQPATFSLRIAGGLRTSLADEGLTSAPAAATPVAVLLTFVRGAAVSRAVIPLRWSVAANGTGTAR